ncbi:MAG: thiamine pyrophosphate-dependent acetolactate synthase large subunit-like protein [Planctomycetota bacterium]|jgi:thiamine pyrophosphate-dependent acetolactate synthase large subunit-like protein
MEPVNPGTLDRRQVVKSLLQDRGELLVVSGLGSPSYDVMAAGDHDCNYYLWAAMGSAVTVGLGIAKAQPGRKVLVITGDGEMLMGLGALATIAVQKPANLSIAVLDNGHYGETGMQSSHAGQGIALDKIAAACGFDCCEQIDDMGALETLRQRIHAEPGLNFATIRIAADSPPRVIPSRDGVHIKNRFRAALGFSPI